MTVCLAALAVKEHGRLNKSKTLHQAVAKQVQELGMQGNINVIGFNNIMFCDTFLIIKNNTLFFN